MITFEELVDALRTLSRSLPWADLESSYLTREEEEALETVRAALRENP